MAYQNGIDCGPQACSLAETFMNTPPTLTMDAESSMPRGIVAIRDIQCSHVMRKNLLSALPDLSHRGYLHWYNQDNKPVGGWTEDGSKEIMEQGLENYELLDQIRAELEESHSKDSKWCNCGTWESASDQIKGSKSECLWKKRSTVIEAEQEVCTSDEGSRYVPSIQLDRRLSQADIIERQSLPGRVPDGEYLGKGSLLKRF
jgi:hypothetical protein